MAPQTVEEAYRRKCVQLKNRTNEVEEANDAARLRLTRIKRQVEKLRIERAFLLEQLSKRTSANVEDSEGSPSPPPTPKDKPLRIKRGHRKVSTIAEDGKEDGGPESPTQEGGARGSKRAKTANGVRKSKKNTTHKSAFELYCDETRPILEAKNVDDLNIEEELTKGWKELAELDKDSKNTYRAKNKNDVQNEQNVQIAIQKKKTAVPESKLREGGRGQGRLAVVIFEPRQHQREGGTHTDPFQLFAVAVAQLVLEHGEEIGNDVQALRQEADALVHLKVAADGLVDGLELGLDPEELGRVKHGAVEVDVDAQNEELANLHVNLRPAQRNLAGEGNLRGNVFARLDRRRDELLEQGRLNVC
ncbi:hypothetical protein CRV24_007735 [Beauveria bassiana]|nr:hypothetical protein CRV24_007735 [Beauveria bassiana]